MVKRERERQKDEKGVYKIVGGKRYVQDGCVGRDILALRSAKEGIEMGLSWRE